MVEVEPGPLLLSLAISALGFIFFSYGKKMSRAPQMLVGLILLVFPYFVDQMWIMGLVALVVVGLLWLALRLGW
jgi:hypothetical protein